MIPDTSAVLSESPYRNMGADNPSAILTTSDPDVISHPPITSQPSLTSSIHSAHGAWTYTPSGPAPLERRVLYGSVVNTRVSEQPELHLKQSRPGSRNSGVVTPMAGSRDWARGLFDAFRGVRVENRACQGLWTLCAECCQVSCMMCTISSSLGDKSWLPFVPGTGAAIRFKVRILGGIQGSIANDCLVTSCCCPCAVCQMHREIEDIGLGATQ